MPTSLGLGALPSKRINIPHIELVSGSFSASGAIVKLVPKAFIGTLGFLGSGFGTLVFNIARTSSTYLGLGALPVPRYVVPTRLSLEGSMTSTGELTKGAGQVIEGTLSLAGALGGPLTKAVAGTLSLAGTLVRMPGKLVAGTWSAVGALLSGNQFSVDGTLSFAGDLTTQFGRLLDGLLTSAGDLTRQTGRMLDGILHFAADQIVRGVILVGTLTFSGTAAGIQILARAIDGTLELAGTLGRLPIKALAGILNYVGTALKQTRRAIIGTLAPTGTAVGTPTFQTQDVEGTLAPTGTLLKFSPRAYAGTMTSAGATAKQARKPFAGAVTSAGELTTVYNEGGGGGPIVGFGAYVPVKRRRRAA